MFLLNARAGLLLMIAGCAAASQPGASTAFVASEPDAGLIRIAQAQQPILLYQWSNTTRAHLKELYTPAGVQLLLDSPPDHPHHHGGMFAVTVNGVDFWAEGDKCGSENDPTKAGPETWTNQDAVISQTLEWSPPEEDHASLLREQRDIRVAYAGADAVLISWHTQLHAQVSEARLTGSHYCGLGMRFVRAMDKNGQFINSEQAAGEVVRGDEKLYPGRWCAYLSNVDGKPVTVAMFDHPDNARPATWFTMAEPFAYLSATLRLHEKPLIAAANSPLALQYGIAAWDGHASREVIESMYQTWIKLNPAAGPHVKPTSSAGEPPAATPPHDKVKP